MTALNQLWATPFYRSSSAVERADSLRDYILANEKESLRKSDSPQRAHPSVFEQFRLPRLAESSTA